MNKEFAIVLAKTATDCACFVASFWATTRVLHAVDVKLNERQARKAAEATSAS